MIRSQWLWLVLAVCFLGSLGGCSNRGGGGGGGDDDDDSAGDDDDAVADDDDAADDDDTVDDDDTADDDDDATPQPDSKIDGSASFPFLSMADPVDHVFPTYLAHLMGSSIGEPWWERDFSCVELSNEGGAPVTLEVEAELLGYTTPVTELVELEVGEDDTICLNPVADLGDLYALTSEATAQARIRAHDASTGALLWQATEQVRVATRRDVWWSLSGMPSRSSVAALVRPDANQVIDLLDDIVELSWFNGSIGTGGYRAEAATALWPQQSSSASAGSYTYWPFYVEAGRSVSFSMDSNGADSWGYVLDSGEFANLADGDEFLVWWAEEIDTLQTGTFVAPSSGWYYLVAYNYSSIFSETVTWQRTMTRADNVLDYLQIIYTHLQDEGINYISVSDTWFDLAQQCLLPDEVIANGGGNCIDGTLLFASLLEQIGVRPIITFVPGHAFISVDSGPSGGNTVWSLETTAMGTGADFWDALSAGLEGHANASFDGQYNLDMYVDAARADDILPMP